MMATAEICKWHWCVFVKCIDIISYATGVGQLHLNYNHPKSFKFDDEKSLQNNIIKAILQAHFWLNACFPEILYLDPFL